MMVNMRCRKLQILNFWRCYYKHDGKLKVSSIGFVVWFVSNWTGYVVLLQYGIDRLCTL